MFKKIIRPSLLLVLIVIFLTVSSGCSQFKTSLLNRVKANASADGSAADSQAAESLLAAASSESAIQETSDTSLADMTTVAEEVTTSPGTDDIGGSTTSSDVAGGTNGTGETGDSNGTSDETSGDKAGSTNGTEFGITDPVKQRDYFKRGVEAFEKQNYVMAEYYLNQVKDTYTILADHIFYYYAKSLLMEKNMKKPGSII